MSDGGPLSVAMVCPYSLSRPGGVQGQVTGLTRALGALGHRVIVIGPDEERPLGPTDGTYVLGRPQTLRANGSRVPVCLSPAAAWRALHFARRHGFDVVHLHEPMAPVASYGFLLARPFPTVGTFHRDGESAWYQAMRPVARWAAGRIDVACAVSEAARATAERALGGEYEVLFNGVEVERYQSARPWPTDAPTVLFVGRHEPRKGLEVLLEAFSAVPDPAVLWVAGSGPQTEALCRRFPPSGRIEWLGRLSDDEVAARMAGAQVLCAPSLWGESFGMVLLEAMAAGCAVVASDLPGYRAASGGHARFFPPGDRAALAGALTDVLAGAVAGAPEVTALRRAGVEHARAWSMGRLAERYVDLYHRAVAARGAGEAATTGR